MLFMYEPEAAKPIAKKPKRMMEITQAGDAIHVAINFSSLDLIQTCKRKAHYALQRKLINQEENSATLFGSAIHKGLEHWYRTSRKLRSNCRDGSFAGAACADASCTRCASIADFNTTAESLRNLDLGDKRHPYNGERILDAYFTKYSDDPFEVHEDEHGPVVEREFQFELCTLDWMAKKVVISVFGTIDCVLRNVETNTIVVCDHKTTSSLGSDFYQRIKPNFQYTCYVMGAKRALGIDTDLFLVNGLQVAKTKVDLARQVTQRTAEDFEEFTLAMRQAVIDYLDCFHTRQWPQATPNACCNYGGCQYRAICEVPAALKENVISAMYKSKELI